MFMTFNDNSTARRRYYQALDALLDIELSEDLDVSDYIPNLTKMFGKDIMEQALGTIDGSVRFFGLTESDLNLKNLDKHQKLIESYNKLQKAKRKFHHS
jgi:ribosomal protein S12 methylthiotransferase accessory factor